IHLVRQLFHLLRRRPPQRADEVAGLRHGGDRFVVERFARDHLGQVEVKNVRLAVFVDADVSRLEIAMNDTVNMRGVDRVADPSEEFKRATNLCPLPLRRLVWIALRWRLSGRGIGRPGIGTGSSALDEFVERVAGNILHDIEEAAGGRAFVDDGDDTRMIELSQDACTALQPRAVSRVGHRAAFDHLQGYALAGRSLYRLIYDALGAAVDLARDSIAREHTGGWQVRVAIRAGGQHVG